MTFSHLLCFLALLSLPCVGVGQSLSGTVTDATGAPLPSAQLVLRTGAPIIGFALTDAAGAFSLELPDPRPDSLSLEVRYFGYATRTFAAGELSATHLREIRLRQEGVELREVVVSAKELPQITRGDTLIHKTEAYRDGSEEKIEEVIAKLPGVEVDGAGAITVHGKPLDRILVDGEDLFDKNYKLLSKNVPADLVDRIDVIKDYQEDELVGDLATAAETVLNLHLDADRTGLLFGEVAAELGHPRHRFGNSSLFRFGKKVKSVNFADYTTLGYPSGVGTQLTTQSLGLSGRPPVEPEPVLRTAAARRQRLLRPQDYLNNTAFGMAQSFLLRLDKRTKNRLMVSYGGDRYGMAETALRENLTPTATDTFRLTHDFRHRVNQLWLQNDFERILDDKSRLDVRTQVRAGRTEAVTRTMNEDLATGSRDATGTNLRTRPLHQAWHLRYVRRLNPALALRLTGSYERGDLEQDQAYRGAVYRRALPGLPDGDLHQYFSQDQQNLSLTANLLQLAGKTKLNHTVAFRRYHVRNLAVLTTGPELPADPSGIRYPAQETEAATSLHRAFGAASFRGQLAATYFRLPVNPAAPATSATTYGTLALQPNAELELALNRRNTLRIWANAARRTPRADQLVVAPYLADGSRLTTGLDSSYLIRSRTYGFRYGYRNSFQQYGYSFSLFRSHTPNGIRRNVVTDDFVVLERLTAGAATTMTTVVAAYDRYFSKIKTDLRASARLSSFADRFDLGGAPVAATVRRYGAKVRATTRIVPALTYSLLLEYAAFVNALLGATTTQRQVFGEQTLIWRPGKALKAVLRHRAHFPQVGRGGRSVHLLGGELTYPLAGGRLQLGVGGSNLLGQRTLAERGLATFQRDTRTYALRPRTLYVLAKRSF